MKREEPQLKERRSRKTPLLRSWSARSAEAREVLVRFQRVGRTTVGSTVVPAPVSYTEIRGFDSHPADDGALGRASRRPGELAAPGLRPLAATAKQVKCCGDTPARHAGVGGFNSPHLLSTKHRLHPHGLFAVDPAGSSESDARVDFTWLSGSTDSGRWLFATGSSGTRRERRTLFSAGLAERLGTGLPPRPRGFDPHGPHVCVSPL